MFEPCFRTDGGIEATSTSAFRTLRGELATEVVEDIELAGADEMLVPAKDDDDDAATLPKDGHRTSTHLTTQSSRPEFSPMRLAVVQTSSPFSPILYPQNVGYSPKQRTARSFHAASGIVWWSMRISNKHMTAH